MGELFRSEMSASKSKLVKSVRGKGLLNAVEIAALGKVNAWEVCMRLAKHGVLAKPTREHIIRFTPPLVITAEQMREGIAAIQKSLDELEHEAKG